MVYVTSANRNVIVEAVQAMYTDVARDPARGFHFPTGRAAGALVGYPDGALASLPPGALASFAGVGYPFAANVIRPGDVVLDVGSGSGTDTLLAAAAVGPSGQVIGLDMTPAMLERLAASVDAARAANVRRLRGDAEDIPLPDAAVDVVTSNGVLNLVPDKRAAFAEICRVLRPGGRLQLADIVLGRPVPADCLSDPALWAECILGATREDDYIALVRDAGLEGIEVLGRFDYFAASASAETRSIARSLNACSIVVRAVKTPVAPLPPPLPWPPPPPPGAPAAMPSADAVLDGCGQTCGTLEPAMKAALRPLASGQVLEVVADDPAARLGVPAWCRLAGHTLVAATDAGDGRIRFFLRRR